VTGSFIFSTDKPSISIHQSTIRSQRYQAQAPIPLNVAAMDFLEFRPPVVVLCLHVHLPFVANRVLPVCRTGPDCFVQIESRAGLFDGQHENVRPRKPAYRQRNDPRGSQTRADLGRNLVVAPNVFVDHALAAGCVKDLSVVSRIGLSLFRAFVR